MRLSLRSPVPVCGEVCGAGWRVEGRAQNAGARLARPLLSPLLVLPSHRRAYQTGLNSRVPRPS